MIDHVAIPVRDLAASRRFYDQILAGLDAKVVEEWPGGVLYAGREGFFALRESGEVAPVHVAFKAERPEVDAFHAAALDAGGSDNGEPGIRSDYHDNYYAAFVLDLDGHNVEAVCHRP